MKRRDVLIGGLVAASAIRMAGAQQVGKTARIGYLSGGSTPDINIESFRDGMRALGYVEGQDFVIEARYANRDYSRFPALVDELLRTRVELIITGGAATQAAPLVGRSVPVVFGFTGDPVVAGVVASFARPSGNATGVSFLSLDLAVKRIDLLKETVPAISRVAVLSNPAHAGEPSELRVTRETARDLGLAIEYFQVRTDDSFEPTFAAVAESKCDALIALPDGMTLFHREPIATFALRRRLPSIFGWKVFTVAGGLMSYGPNFHDVFAHLAVYVDKILKGAKPADLPVEQPTKFELIINLKTAKALGITIPQSVLLRADEVIE
jgi:putative ABC transport system substrate-binding protein